MTLIRLGVASMLLAALGGPALAQELGSTGNSSGGDSNQSPVRTPKKSISADTGGINLGGAFGFGSSGFGTSGIGSSGIGGSRFGPSSAFDMSPGLGGGSALGGGGLGGGSSSSSGLGWSSGFFGR